MRRKFGRLGREVGFWKSYSKIPLCSMSEKRCDNQALFWFHRCARLLLRIHCKRPERRISLCWEASRALTPGPRPGWGSVRSWTPAANLMNWDWHQCDKSQGFGDGVARQTFLPLLSTHFVIPLSHRFRSFVGCMSPPSTSA